MSQFYFDSSAIIKRYSTEVGSAWVQALCDPALGHGIILSEITIAEVAAARAAKHRAPNGISRVLRDAALALFLLHCRTLYDLVAVRRSTIDQAAALTQKHRLRGYDAVQLATSISVNQSLGRAGAGSVVLITSDRDLVLAAQQEGLVCDNPISHP